MRFSREVALDLRATTVTIIPSGLWFQTAKCCCMEFLDNTPQRNLAGHCMVTVWSRVQRKGTFVWGGGSPETFALRPHPGSVRPVQTRSSVFIRICVGVDCALTISHNTSTPSQVSSEAGIEVRCAQSPWGGSPAQCPWGRLNSNLRKNAQKVKTFARVGSDLLFPG